LILGAVLQVGRRQFWAALTEYQIGAVRLARTICQNDPISRGGCLFATYIQFRWKDDRELRSQFNAGEQLAFDWRAGTIETLAAN